MFVPFGEWLPDQPAYANPGTDVAYNVLPRTSQSYAPMASLSVYSTTGLGSRCQGAIPTLDSTGSVAIFAGDLSNLYKLAPGSLAFSRISKSVAAYNVPSDGRWSMVQFGQDILATDYNDGIQTYTLNSSALFADLGGTPPKAKYIAVVRNFVVIGFTNDGTFGIQPQRVWWGGINSSTSWLTPGTSAALAVQSDYQDIPGDHGWIMGIVPNLGFADAALFFERAVYRMQYSGSPYFFTIAPAEKIHGTPAPGSLVQYGAVVYYLSDDGFYAFDGANAVPIGALKVDKFFYSDTTYAVDQTYMDRISGTVDPINKIVYWAYADATGSGTPNRILAYHTVLNRWSFIKDPGSIEILFRALSIGYTLTQLSPGLYATMADIPLPLDSRVYTAGKPVLAAFDTSHQIGYFTGANLAPQIETSEVEPTPGRRSRITSARPIVDAGTPALSIGHRTRVMDALTYSTAVDMNVLGECPCDVDDRYMRIRMTLPAAGSFLHLQGVDVDVRPGARF